ncbi:hypothetical protein IMZ48_10180, partial [Candidatus Bathyarchaeota archaeon]|nr:hypothetical protein [Candidatus Bathyarchaeota archaeon]
MVAFHFYCVTCLQLAQAPTSEKYASHYKGRTPDDGGKHFHTCRVEVGNHEFTEGLPVVDTDGSITFQLPVYGTKYTFPKGTIKASRSGTSGYILAWACFYNYERKREFFFQPDKAPLSSIKESREISREHLKGQKLLGMPVAPCRGTLNRDGYLVFDGDKKYRITERSGKKARGGEEARG